MAEYYGFNPPFLGGVQNILSRQEDEKLIKNDILQLLLTIPGERVNRPNFGTNLRNSVFDPDYTVLTSLETEIISAINTYEPRVTVENVNVTVNDNSANISIIVRLVRNPDIVLTIDRLIELQNNAGL